MKCKLFNHKYGMWGDTYQYSDNSSIKQARRCLDCGKIQTRTVIVGFNDSSCINKSANQFFVSSKPKEE